MQLVLIVDDDVLVRAQLSRAVSKLPAIEVVEACCLAEAKALLEGLEVDLVICDLELPDGTALHLLPLVQQSAHQTSIVVISGYIDRLARLPSGIEVCTKPIAATALRELVVRRLGTTEPRSPFSLVDYLELAAFGCRSVLLEVLQGDDSVGEILIWQGDAWTATDILGEGIDAVVRLVGVPDTSIVCRAVPSALPLRTLHGSCGQLLADASRAVEERSARRPATAPHLRKPEPPRIQIPAPRPRQETPPRPLPTVRAVAPAGPDPQEFDRLYGIGIDALIGKRYREAFDTLMRAREIRSTPTLEANLSRLRTMGFQ